MVTYVYRNGARLTPHMFYQIERLNFDLKKLFGVEVYVTSGIRLPQEQIDIFLKRYVTAGNINGRKVYDTRVWRGTRYYRISRLGTVAVPGTSNHEIQGSNAAVDIRDTGSGPGIATAGSARAKWLRENCWRYDMVAEGYNFKEPWHYKTLNIFNAVPGGGGANPQPAPKPEPEEEDEDMATKPVGHYIGGTPQTPAEQRMCVIYYPDSGYYEKFSGVNQGYINDQAASHGTGNFTIITEKHWEQQCLPKLEKLLNK